MARPPRKPASIPPGEDWPTYRRQVVSDLEELRRESREQLAEIHKLTSTVGVLQARVTIYALGAGSVAAALVTMLAQIVAYKLGH